MIAFAGDALICVFLDKPPSEDAIEEEDESDIVFPGASKPKTVNACYRALQCACVLRSHKTKYLSAHIGVSYGEMSIALLGGVNNQWVYLMNGAVTFLSLSCNRIHAQCYVFTYAFTISFYCCCCCTVQANAYQNLRVASKTQALNKLLPRPIASSWLCNQKQ